MIKWQNEYPLLERIAGLMRDQPEALDVEPLLADDKYQTRNVTLHQLTQEVAAQLRRTLQHRSVDDLPLLFCSWGKCRVGSTALTNLFGIAGMPAFYQPVKTMARYRLLGSESQEWHPPHASDHPHIFAKEMAGPYLLFETLFNPLEILTAAGYPREKLHLLVMDRDPFQSLASWVARWSEKIPRARLVEHFAISSLQVHSKRAYARAHGIAVTHFAYEASRRPLEAIEALFRRLGISRYFRPGVVQDWNERGALNSKQSAISFPEEPLVYVVLDLHSSENQYAYKERDTGTLTEAERELVREFRLPNLYREVVSQCIGDLGFDQSLSLKMFGPDFALTAPGKGAD
jgi:hypothetical protein